MGPRNNGIIVQVGSALAYRGIPLQSAYCGAKHAIVGFTESLRTDCCTKESNVQVTMVHMPAMNTPQFDWVRSRLPHRAQPVPPIYQPEVGARAVAYAAEHPARRAYYVGLSTTLTVLGNKVAPQILDRYLARTGFGAQQTHEREDPDRPDNLEHPVPGDFAAHGRFDRRSHHHADLVLADAAPPAMIRFGCPRPNPIRHCRYGAASLSRAGPCRDPEPPASAATGRRGDQGLRQRACLRGERGHGSTRCGAPWAR